jgi:hypothetical protein
MDFQSLRRSVIQNLLQRSLRYYRNCGIAGNPSDILEAFWHYSRNSECFDRIGTSQFLLRQFLLRVPRWMKTTDIASVRNMKRSELIGETLRATLNVIATVDPSSKS